MKKNRQRDFELIYKRVIELVKDYRLTEEEYFDYYQNSNDPTFENYPFELEVKVNLSDTVSYYDTVVNTFKQGKNLTLLTWQDFMEFVIEWSLRELCDSCSITYGHNGGVTFITTKNLGQLGQVKCVWITKKFASHRPVGVKTIRELDYLISANKASKGIIVTTSRLTKGAIKLIDENEYRMSYVDNSMLEKELKGILVKDEKQDKEEDDLPF